jgi:hypothetical protein
LSRPFLAADPLDKQLEDLARFATGVPPAFHYDCLAAQ